MELKTSHILIGVLFLVFLGNGDRIAGSLGQASTHQQTKSEFSSDRREARQTAREAGKRSKIALDRVKAGCVPIVDIETQQPYYFNEGTRVQDPVTGRVLDQGIVCNSLGVTAEVVDGQITDVILVSPEHKAEYVGHFTMQHGAK